MIQVQACRELIPAGPAPRYVLVSFGIASGASCCFVEGNFASHQQKCAYSGQGTHGVPGGQFNGLLQAAAAKRGMRISGGEVDTERMARVLLDEYRGSRLGRFTLEVPEGV